MIPFSRVLARLKRLVVFALALAAVSYSGDFMWLHIRMMSSKLGKPFDSVHLERFYAVSRKDGRYEFLPAPPEDQACVNALFPHAGLSPCWYVKRLNGKPIMM